MATRNQTVTYLETSNAGPVVRSVAEPFADLARDVRERWARFEYSDLSFRDVAGEALDAHALHRGFSPEEFLSGIANSDELEGAASVHKSRGLFNIVETETFAVDVHIWTHELALPHTHKWIGAYQVLHGQVLHKQYTFEPDTEYHETLKLGHLSPVRCDLTGPGFTRLVDPGFKFVHNLAYITPLGMAVSLRKRRIEGNTFSIHRPHVAIADFPESRTRTLKLRTIDWSERFDDAWRGDLLTDVIRNGDVLTIWDILLYCYSKGLEVPEKALGIGRDRFGGNFQRILAALEELDAYRLATQVRKDDYSAAVNTTVAALEVGDNADEVRSLIKMVAPDEDPDRYLGRALSKILLQPEDESPIPEPVVEAVTDIVRGRPVDEIVARLRASATGDPHIDNHCAVATELHRQMRDVPLYKVLFKNRLAGPAAV